MQLLLIEIMMATGWQEALRGYLGNKARDANLTLRWIEQ